MAMTLPASVEQWRDSGRMIPIERRHRLRRRVEHVFTIDRGDPDAPTVVLLHGFPGSTFEWRHVIADLAVDHRVVSHDFVGFGLSDKPVDGDYSLFTQADRTERVLSSYDVGQAVIVAHDVGDTVAAELLQRQNDGVLFFDIAGCVLTNGSIFIDLVQLSDGQQALLALPDEPLAESLGSELLRVGLAATFPPGVPASDELDAIVALVEHNGGDLLLPRLIRYIEERRQHQPRWTAGLVAATIPMTAVWGELDPIAVAAMVERLERLRRDAGNSTEVVRWSEGWHWPPVERPAELAAVIRRSVAAWY
jgi:pimeloyl-ACP methyl ester carboxylesterase